MSAKHGSKATYPTALSLISLYILFHIIQIIRFKSQPQNAGKAYFSKENSVFFRVINGQRNKSIVKDLNKSAGSSIVDGTEYE